LHYILCIVTEYTVSHTDLRELVEYICQSASKFERKWNYGWKIYFLYIEIITF